MDPARDEKTAEGWLLEDLERQRGRLLRVAFGMLRDAAEAEDAVQDTYLSAWEHRARFRSEALTSSWMHRICVNHCLMRLRRQRVVSQTLAPYVVAFPAPDAELRDALRQGIAGLTAPQRALLNGFFLEGRSHADLARAGRTTIPAIKSHVFRVRRTMRAVLA